MAPGHHLAWALARESACLVRQDHGDTLHHEGWAVLAEELFHEAGACGGGTADGWLRATERWGAAWGAAFDLLVHAQAAPEDELLALLRLVDPKAELADLGDRVGEPGSGAAYHLGPAELRRLRADALRRGLDARTFHERLLRLGPLPPALAAAELYGGR